MYIFLIYSYNKNSNVVSLLICVVSLLTNGIINAKEKRYYKMKTLTSAINVQVDARDKEQATNILKDLGINMSTFINMAIKQVIKKDGLPFEVTNPKPSDELLDALKEGEDIIQEIRDGKRTGYNNVNEMLRAIIND